MNKIRLLLIFILSSVSFIGCNLGDQCDPDMICNIIPYDSGWVDIKFSDSGSDSIYLILYSGFVEDNTIIGDYYCFGNKKNFYLPIGDRYSAEAFYNVGQHTIVALDGGRLNENSVINCEETCYDESKLNLDLRKL